MKVFKTLEEKDKSIVKAYYAFMAVFGVIYLIVMWSIVHAEIIADKWDSLCEKVKSLVSKVWKKPMRPMVRKEYY